MRAALRGAERLAGEGGAGQAFEAALLAERDCVPRAGERDARGDAAAGWAAVDLAIGEDADVPARRERAIAAIGHDGAIEIAQVGIVRMPDRHLRLDRLADPACPIDDGGDRRPARIEAEGP